MSLKSRLRRLRASRKRRRLASRVERLEERRVLTTYLVDTIADNTDADSQISLREAIQAANTNTIVGDAPAGEAGPATTDTITFAASLSGQTITLSNLGPLTISDNLSISTSSSVPVTISGDNSRQIFVVADGAGSFPLTA